MIQRKIHFCWFSGDPYSDVVLRCMDSWQKYMPGCELVKWDMERISAIDSIWLKECLQMKKWAFAADYVRLWAIYHEGGIYLDSDVLLHAPLDDYLDNKMFIGREDCCYPTLEAGMQVFLTSHCFGAEPGHPFIKLCMDYYEDRHFIQTSSEMIPNGLRLDMLMMPYIQSHLAQEFGYDARLGANHIQRLTNGVTVYPSKVFGRYYGSFVKFGSVAEHLGAGSWREPARSIADSKPIKYTIGYKILWRIVYALGRILSRFDYVIVKL